MRLAVVASLLLAAAASAPAVAATRTFPVGGFDRVRSDVPFDVRVHVGGPVAVHAAGADQILARLHVTVRGGELVIGADPGRWYSNFVIHKADRVMIDVTMPRIAGAALNGPGGMVVDTVRAPAFSATVSGPGSLTIGAIDTGRAEMSIDGPGGIHLTGKSGAARILGRGPGDLYGAGWTIGDVNVALMGPGSVEVTALRTATVRVMGPGDVHINGHPRCEVSKMGPGSVVCGR